MAQGGSGITLGFLKYVLGFDALAFEQGVDAADKRMKKAQRDIEKHARKIAGIGTAMSLGITTPLLGFGAVALKEAQESSAAMAQVNAALKSMGPVAGRTAEQLKAAADQMELSSLAEGDEILRKITANMLTFGNITGANFDKAQQAALDLSARLGTDLQSSAILVGKALNDPIKGMAALGRAGIQFSTDQKAAIAAMVKTGDVAGAQAIILGEFQKQFGGAAQAAQNADPFNKASDAFKQMAETVGTALLPIIPIFTDAIVSIASAFSNLSPTTQKWLIIIGGVAAALGPVLVGFGALVSMFGTMLPLVLKLGPAFKIIQTGFLIMRAAALASLPALLPFLVPLAAIAAAVGAVYLAWKNWDKIKAIVSALYNTVKTYLLDKLNAVWNGVKAGIDRVTGFFRGLWDAVVGHSYIPDMVDGIRDQMARLDAVMVAPAREATKNAGEAFKALRERVGSILAELFPEVAAYSEYLSKKADLLEWAKRQKMSADMVAEALHRLEAAYGILQPDLTSEAIVAPVDVEALLRPLLGMGDKAQEATVRVAKSFEDMVKNVSASVKGFVEAIKGGGFFDILDSFIGLATTLGSAGAFGKKIQTSLNNTYQNRALGGPVIPGKRYMVGESGPEWFTPARGGHITPNNDNGGRGNSYYFSGNLMTPEFWAQIQASQQRAEIGGGVRGESAIYRRARNTYP